MKKARTKRGVSLADYELYRRMIAAGRTTWAKLEKAGKVNPSRRRWRQNQVLRELRENR